MKTAKQHNAEICGESELTEKPPILFIRDEKFWESNANNLERENAQLRAEVEKLRTEVDSRRRESLSRNVYTAQDAGNIIALHEETKRLRAQCDSMLKEQLLRDREITRLRAEVEKWREDAERLMEAFDSCWGCVDGCDCVRCQAIAAHYALIKGQP